MKHLSHIPLIILMLWTSAVSYATDIEVQSGYKTEVCIKNVCTGSLVHGSKDLISILIELRNSESLVPISLQTSPMNHSKENVHLNGKLDFKAYDQDRFGILNTNTRKIEYVTDPTRIKSKPDSYTQLKEIKVTDDKMYFLISDRTLHFFEKSEKIK